MSYAKNRRPTLPVNGIATSRANAWDAETQSMRSKDEAWYLAHGFPPDYARTFAQYDTANRDIRRGMSTDERESMAVIEQRYDATMNVRPEDLPDGVRANLESLQRLGAIRFVNGRVIPSFILEEHVA